MRVHSVTLLIQKKTFHATQQSGQTNANDTSNGIVHRRRGCIWHCLTLQDINETHQKLQHSLNAVDNQKMSLIIANWEKSSLHMLMIIVIYMYLAVMLMALYICGINSCIFVQFLIKKLLFGTSLQYAKHCIAVYSVR